MQTTSVLARDDTFFGVCEALGEDFRFHPNLLRVGFALALFVNPLAAVGAYAGAGLVVAISRWFVPNPKVEAPEQPLVVETETAGGSERIVIEPQPEELAIAA